MVGTVIYDIRNWEFKSLHCQQNKFSVKACNFSWHGLAAYVVSFFPDIFNKKL